MAIALAVATAAAAKPPLTKGVYSGVITVGRGAAGITLGMTRAQVIAHLGRPFADYGREMDYFRLPPKYPSRGLFVVYLAKSRVHMIQTDGEPNSGWRLSDGNRIFASGGYARLMHRYGRRLRLMRTEDGEPFYRITGRLNGLTVWTAFFVWPLNPKGMVEGVDILFPPNVQGSRASAPRGPARRPPWTGRCVAIKVRQSMPTGGPTAKGA
jgi:hypothetical protein